MKKNLDIERSSRRSLSLGPSNMSLSIFLVIRVAASQRQTSKLKEHKTDFRRECVAQRFGHVSVVKEKYVPGHPL